MYTNLTGLPDAIARAVEHDPYDPGESDITVTGLLRPARQRVLYAQHSEEIVEDVADRVWALLGQAVHHILERAGQDIGEPVEERLYTAVLGWKVGGKYDSLRLKLGRLSDYKVTSVWVRFGGSRIPEWTAQLNMLAALCRINRIQPIDSLSIIAIYRDWSRAELERMPDKYPPKMSEEIAIEAWSQKDTLRYMRDRVRIQQIAIKHLPLCTDEERWLNANTGRYRRCENYCPVAPFCEQWAYTKERQEKERAEKRVK